MYIVVGASGFLGSYIVKNILRKTNEDVLAVARNTGQQETPRVKWVKCDITNLDEVMDLNKNYFIKGRSNKIIYLAAYHNPDLVERNPKTAWEVNITSLSRFLNAVENVACFFYASTEYVYGGSKGNYRFQENDALHPVNRYGLHKSIAECLVNGFGYNVVRFPFLIGKSLVPGKMHFYDTIVQTISRGNSIDMFSDSCQSALDFNTASELLIQVMEKYPADIPPILNICGDEALSKYDIGITIARQIGVSEQLIHPVSVQDETGIYKVRRARGTLMDNTRLKEILKLQEIKIDL